MCQERQALIDIGLKVLATNWQHPDHEPSNENRQVAPGRKPNAEVRTREYLTVAEVEKLIKAAKSSRYGHRDANADPDRLPAWPRDCQARMATGRIQPVPLVCRS